MFLDIFGVVVGFAVWSVGLLLLWRAFLKVTNHFWPEQPEQRK